LLIYFERNILEGIVVGKKLRQKTDKRRRNKEGIEKLKEQRGI